MSSPTCTHLGPDFYLPVSKDGCIYFPDPANLAQFSGLLAAFTFGSLVVILSDLHGKKEASHLMNAAQLLVANVFLLLLSTLFFILTRALMEEQIGAYLYAVALLDFGLGAILMFISITWMVYGYSLSSIATVSARWIAYLATTIVVIFMISSLYNTLRVVLADLSSNVEHTPTWLFYAMFLQTLVLIPALIFQTNLNKTRAISALARGSSIFATLLAIEFARAFGNTDVPDNSIFKVMACIGSLITVGFAAIAVQSLPKQGTD